MPNATVDTTATGAFGVEAAGVTAGVRIVSLRAGVLFEGADAASFLANPFEPFAFAFDYRLTIPAFVGTDVEPTYRADDVPVSGPVEEAARC